jgi:hypothetical protein
MAVEVLDRGSTLLSGSACWSSRCSATLLFVLDQVPEGRSGSWLMRLLARRRRAEGWVETGRD